LVSIFLLGELSTHIVFILSFPALRVAQEVTSQEGGGRSQRPLPNASPWVASRTRRLFDCAFAACALLGLLPLLVLCWMLVRSTSAGPVFFKQRRMGRNGSEFDLYKFRSMHWQHNGSGPGHTVQNDLRITRVGALLRRYNLDELPQFWNGT
jgi:lipopolysaccharide/colanic/teichoic acid biosynthesis glycosyltransferase